MELQGWDKLYQELAEKITTNIPEVNWLDLWHNQVGFLVEEHPFPTPAVFLSFRILNTEDLSEHIQQANMQIDVYYFYETFLDTYTGAYNQLDALNYLKTLTDIHKILHASNGDNYAEMRRTGLTSVDTGSSGNLYRQTFVCTVVDQSSMLNYNEAVPGEVNFENGIKVTMNETPSYIIP